MRTLQKFTTLSVLLFVPFCAISQSLVDYDVDDDGLIEVHNLAQLNAIRYDLDGDGYVDSSVSDSDSVLYMTAFGALDESGPPCVGYELMSNLNFAGTRWALNATTDGISDAVLEGWEPIGDESNRYFNTFDGNEYTITGLYINRPATDYVGLFGAIKAGAIIHNVFLEEVEVHGKNYVGRLAGESAGSITASYATGTVTGSFHVGGLVGQNNGSITASYATGTVIGDDYVGGLVGFNYGGSITSSYATGTVTGTVDAVTGTGDYVGGLVGQNSGSITSSYATGSVTGDALVGGLVGNNSGGGIISASYATGSVMGNSDVGGLVGSNFNGTITSSYATGTVTGVFSVGGLVGYNGGIIMFSYYSSAAVVTRGDDAVPPNNLARSVAELASVPTADALGIFEDWAVDAEGNSVPLVTMMLFGTLAPVLNTLRSRLTLMVMAHLP